MGNKYSRKICFFNLCRYVVFVVCSFLFGFVVLAFRLSGVSQVFCRLLCFTGLLRFTGLLHFTCLLFPSLAVLTIWFRAIKILLLRRFCFNVDALMTWCPCLDGDYPAKCHINPCEDNPCPLHPSARCHINFCGRTCSAEFYLDGRRVNCDSTFTSWLREKICVGLLLPLCVCPLWREIRTTLQSNFIHIFLNGADYHSKLWVTVCLVKKVFEKNDVDKKVQTLNVKKFKRCAGSGVASPKFFGGSKMFDFRRVTVLYLGHRF